METQTLPQFEPQCKKTSQAQLSACKTTATSSLPALQKPEQQPKQIASARPQETRQNAREQKGLRRFVFFSLRLVALRASGLCSSKIRKHSLEGPKFARHPRCLVSTGPGRRGLQAASMKHIVDAPWVVACCTLFFSRLRLFGPRGLESPGVSPIRHILGERPKLLEP